MIYRLQKAGVFSEDSLHIFDSEMSMVPLKLVLQITKFGSLPHFLLKNIPPFDLFFSVNFCYIYFGEMSRGIFFSGYGSHGNQEDAVFFISMVTIAKGKNSSAYFRMLMWTSIP